MRAWRKRTHAWMLVAGSGGSLLALNSCDPAVRDTVLSGVGAAASGLATTFIEAFIESLAPDEEETPTVVQAKSFHPEIFT